MRVWISHFLFWLMGWKLVGSVPSEFKKYVLIAAPHTSNMDFFLAMPTMWLLGVPGKFLIKKEHIETPYGFLIRWMGGIGVDRNNQSVDFISSLKSIVSKHNELAMLFTPEGTRKRVAKWKTGFYRVALAVEVPIVLAYADYSAKEVHVGHVFHPSGNFKEDWLFMEKFYKDVPAKFPEFYNPEIFLK